MKFIVWLRNVTAARHFFILVSLLIIVLCVYIHILFFGDNRFRLVSAIFNLVVSLFFVHLAWILFSIIYHIIQKEKKPAIAKSVVCILYPLIIYYSLGLYTAVRFIS